MPRILQRNTVIVDFQVRRPGRLADSLANLRDPKMQERLMKWGASIVVANRYVINVHPDDFEEACLDALGDELARQLAEVIAQAIDAREQDRYDCLPLSPDPQSKGWLPTRDKISIEFTQNPATARGTAMIRWDFSQDSDIPETSMGVVTPPPVGVAAPAAGVPAPPPTQMELQRRFAIEIVNGTATAELFPLLADTIAIRRKDLRSPADADGRTLWVDHPKISRNHAELRRTPAGYALVDLDSTNGTRVNNERLAVNREWELEPGDTIELGRAVQLRFQQYADDEGPYTSTP